MRFSIISKSLILSVNFFLSYNVWAQKKVVENSLTSSWPILKQKSMEEACTFSPGGNFYSYLYGPSDGIDSIVIANTKNGIVIKRSTTSNKYAQFTKLEDKVAFLFGKDSLEVYDLARNKVNLRLKGVAQFQLLEVATGQFLIVNTNEGGTRLYSLTDNRTKNFGFNMQSIVSEDGKELFLWSGSNIIVIRLKDFNEKVIFNGQVSAVEVNAKNKDVFFLNISDEKVFKIYHYQFSQGIFTSIFTADSNIVPKGWTVERELTLLPDGTKILIKLKECDSNINKVDAVKAWKLWSYEDRIVTRCADWPATQTILFDIRSGSTLKLFDNTETPITELKVMLRRNHIITQTIDLDDQYVWNNITGVVKIYDLTSGTAKIIDTVPKSVPVSQYVYSADGRYIFWWDAVKNQFLSYNISRDKIIQVTGIEESNIFYDRNNDIIGRRSVYSIGGWTKNDESVFVCDEFDIWKLDPEGKKTAMNLTRGQGRLHRTRLRIVNRGVIHKAVVLSAYNIDNKENGFIPWNMSLPFEFDKKYLGPFGYRDNNTFSALGYNYLGYVPIKAPGSATYIVRRESATQSPNLFLTTDFVNYRSLTHIYPEHGYQWYRNKLVKWQFRNNSPKEEGILYYPENLDTTKKYPLIIHYYEKKSDELNVFKQPSLSYGDLSIPWYTSNGYIVFVPNIRNERGKIRNSLKVSITNALTELGKVEWIDENNVGIQGHSNGGFETYSLITSMNFKAAQASAGFTNLSGYFNHIFGEVLRQSLVQYGQTNMGATPWDDIEAYIRNSPSFHLDSVNTPLLIMHGEKDENVPIWQSKEVYASLRRLQRPCWLLMYENVGHVLRSNIDKLDFTIKQQEFFGYYLKGEKKPEWLR